MPAYSPCACVFLRCVHRVIYEAWGALQTCPCPAERQLVAGGKLAPSSWWLEWGTCGALSRGMTSPAFPARPPEVCYVHCQAYRHMC
jgi:hypothetical protein